MVGGLIQMDSGFGRIMAGLGSQATDGAGFLFIMDGGAGTGILAGIGFQEPNGVQLG